jgi:hypothetical protein
VIASEPDIADSLRVTSVTDLPPPTVTVHLRGLPVPLAARTHQHSEALLREFAFLAAESVEAADDPDREIPLRVLDCVIGLSTQFSAFTTPARERLQAAIDTGLPTIDDHVVELPQEAAAAALECARLLDEADMYCWSREREDLATPADCVAYRRWCFAQVLDQLDGRTPVPWPESTAARSL